MKCEDVQLLLADYDDATLSAAETARVREHLDSCPACAREAEAQRRLAAAFRATPAPVESSRVPAAFQTWLEAEREAASFRSRTLETPRSSWLRVIMGPAMSALAACVLFAAGLVIGTRGLRDDVAPGRDEMTTRELAQLRDEVAAMNQAVTWTLLQQQSTGERLQTVRALEYAPARAQSLNELLGVLAYDPSMTVRQSAVHALTRYAEDPLVRRAVASALPRESSPVVQLAMIDLLATTRDPVAATALEELARSDAPPSAIRDAASLARARM